MSNSIVIIISGDGQRMEMDRRLCMHSRLIKEMLSSLGLDNEANQQVEIPLGSFVKASTMHRIKVSF
jgi:hypothetical protein